MALTAAARAQLGAHIADEGIEQTGVRTDTGLVRVKDALIAPVSTYSGDTRSGILDSGESEENTNKTDSQEIIEETHVSPKTRRGRRRTQADNPKEAPRGIRVDVAVEGFGVIPTMYAHCFVGNGVLILGLLDLSFKPEATESTNGTLSHAVELSVAPGRKYVYCGNRFVDNNGTVNLVLVEVEE